MVSHDSVEGSLIGLMSNKVKKFGGINLAQGIPAFMPPEELINHYKEVIDGPFHQYAPGKGHAGLLKWLNGYLKTEEFYNDDHLLMVNGATEALSLLYIYISRIINGSFTILAFDPIYESYRELPKIFNTPFSTASIPTSSENWDEFKILVKEKNVKLVFLASPGNPWGYIWSKEQLNQLTEIALELDFFVIIDGVYKEQYFDVEPYQLVNPSNPNLFYVNSFSKMLSVTGWRIGYISGNPMHMKAISQMHDYIGLCASHPAQEALYRYLNTNNYSSYCECLRKKLVDNYAFASQMLKKAGFKIPLTKGGYFIWAQLPEPLTDGLSFALKLYDNYRVALVPGQHFSKKSKNYVRINIALPKQELMEGIRKIVDFAREK